MAEYDPQLKRLLLPPEESFFEVLIRYGLYIGAVFQVACILAIVFYHGSSSDGIAALKVCKNSLVSYRTIKLLGFIQHLYTEIDFKCRIDSYYRFRMTPVT